MFKKNSLKDDDMSSNNCFVSNANQQSPADVTKTPSHSRSECTVDNQMPRHLNKNDKETMFTNNNSENVAVLNNNNNNCRVVSSTRSCSFGFLKKPTDGGSVSRGNYDHGSSHPNENDREAIFINNNLEDNAVLNNKNNNCLISNSEQLSTNDFQKKQTNMSKGGITRSEIESPQHTEDWNYTTASLEGPDQYFGHAPSSAATVSKSLQDDQHISFKELAPKATAGCNRTNWPENEADLKVDIVERSFFSSGKDETVVATEYNESASPNANNAGTMNVTQESCELLPEYLKMLVEGKEVCGDSSVPFSKPDWLDMEKFRRGQRFAVNHIFGVMYAELISLMMLFAFNAGLEPLIYTGKSDTPFKAFKRYLSTVTRVKSWYDGDLWDVDSVAHRNFKVVRGMHDAVRKSMNAGNREEIAKRVTLENGEGKRPMWTDLHEDILNDFQSSCPFIKAPLTCPKEVYINQFDMGLTQFGFAGLILVFPSMFGIHWATKDDLDSFAHFWRTIGYLLGTEDRYNLCNGDLATVQQRCRDIIQFWVKPMLRTVSRDWVHMSRCLFKGICYYVPGVSFEVLLLYLCRVLGIQAARLAASLSFWQYFFYLETIFMYSFTFRLPGMWALHNWLINLAVKRAQHLRPERLRKLEQRVYPYQMASEAATT